MDQKKLRRASAGAAVCGGWLVVGWVCAALAAAVPGAEAPNLVGNGGFAEVAGGAPAQWQAEGDAASVTQSLRVGKTAEGKPCAELVCTRCDGGTGSSHAMLAQVGVVRLVKGKSYEFSCRLQAQGLAGGAVSVAISDTKGWTNCGLNVQAPAGGAWRSFARVFRATQDVGASGRLQIWFTEPGTLRVADVRIVEAREEAVEFTDVVPAAGGRNLVPNGSFEAGAGGWTGLGEAVGWGDLPRLHGQVEQGDAAHGKAFLRIPLGGEQTPVLYFDYYQPVVRRELRPCAASKGWIPLQPGATYTLSCSMRASKAGASAVLGVWGQDPSGQKQEYGQAVTVDTAWRRYSFGFQPRQRYGFAFVGPNLKQEEAVYVDVDGVQLERGEKATEYAPRRAVEWSLMPAEADGVFTEGPAPRLALRAANQGAQAAVLVLRLAAEAFDGQAAALPEVKLDLAAGGAAERDVPLPEGWRGYLHVTATSGEGPAGEAKSVRLAVVPRREKSDSVCGINHAFVSADLIHTATKGGIGWYRDWSLKWQHLEPKKGEYHWEVGDAQIDRVIKEKVGLMALLPPFPGADWSSEAPPGLPTQGYPGVRLRQAWAPKDPGELADFIEKAVTRYRDRVQVWEFLNEPIYTDYALPADPTDRYHGKHYTPADYVKLLAPAAAAMRRADPKCRIIGGVAGGPRQDTDALLEAGILRHVDILNLHIYPSLRAPESFAGAMDQLLAAMDRHGGRKPIWITEFSYYGADELPRRPFIPAASSWAESRLLEDERQCADYTLRFLAVMLSRGVEKVFIHSGASSRANEPNYECCLLAEEGAPRKLLPALAVFTELLGPKPVFAGERRSDGQTWIEGFESGTRSVLVLWRTEQGGAAELALPALAEVSWFDTMGRKLAGPPRGLSSSPVYAVGPAGKAKVMLEAMAGGPRP